MPYPVSPPALPPVVDVALPEESPRSSSDLGSAIPEHVAQAESSSIACFPPDCGVIPVRAGVEIASDGVSSVSSAELLGRPLAVGAAGSIGNSVLDSSSTLDQSSDQSSTTSGGQRPTTFLQLPDLDQLTQVRARQPRSSASAVRAAVRAQARQADAAPSASETPSSSETAADPLPNAAPELEPGQDSIRLDLPSRSDQPSETDQPSEIPVDPSADPPSALPSESPNQPAVPGVAAPLPAPLPDPPGEVLTIPTPPRSRQDEAPTSDPPAGAGNAPAGVPIDPQAVGEVLEVRGDRQEFDERQQIFSADGNVQVRFRQGLLTADRVRVNIPNRVAVAEGNAVLTRGDQVLRGERFDYNFGLNQGSILTARGELLLPSTEQDFDPAPPVDVGGALNRPVTERVSSAQPLQVQGGTPGPSFGVGDTRSSQAGNLTRLRFEADRADFDGSNLVAENVRITNDPFSPPELELRSNRVTYTRLSPTSAEIRARNPRLVFDQGFSLPLLVNRLVLDNRRRNSGLFNFGYDEEDRDGFYIERTFDIYSSPLVSFRVTPQILLQRAVSEGSFPDASQFGLVTELDFNFTPTATVQAIASFSSLDFGEVEDNLRASVRAQQRIFNHTVALEYSYRNRLFNGSLGFQDVQSSIGLVVSSPRYVLGDSLVNLNYQAGIQYVNAETDERDLYPVDLNDRDLSCIDDDERNNTGNGCADLARYQAAVTLSRFFLLWFGTPLPPTPSEGLRYSPTPIVPYLGIYTELRGVYSGYSNGDLQATLRGGISLLGQFGRFSKNFFDYTAFSIGYYNTLVGGESPFFFDRSVDNQFVVASLTQQIYGPLRLGVQVSYNLDTSDEIDTVYSLEYARRTYSISANYSTGRSSAALTFRLNDFNWTGDPGPFSGLGSSTVDGGVIRQVN